MEKPTLNPALREFWAQPARNRVLYGGRSSSKSWDAGGFAIFLAQYCRLRFLCTRHLQNKIEESVYTLLKLQIERFGLQDKFRILENKIICKTTGSEFVFYGRWRHIGEIRSLEGIDVHWAEEAHLLSEEQWTVLRDTLRKDGSQHWIIFNPQLVTDFVYRRFVLEPPPDTVVRKINYDENPFLSKTALRVIDGVRETDPDEYAHVYLGQPRQDDEDAIIKRSWLLAAIDAHKALGIEPRGQRRLGFDVADSGDDLCAVIAQHGPLAYWADEWKGRDDELFKSCERVWNRAREDGSSVIYDSIGVGAGCGANFNQINGDRLDPVLHQKFFAGGKVWRPDARYAHTSIKNKDFFGDIKAQIWWLVADKFRNTFNAVRNGRQFSDDEMIFLDSSMPHLEKLITELSTPRRDYDRAGRVKVESKAELKKRGIPSHNLADGLIMAESASMHRPMRISDEVLRAV